MQCCSMTVLDIAGIATSRRATLAALNTTHFEDTGVHLVNPWSPTAR